jgi:hypothetical protein
MATVTSRNSSPRNYANLTTATSKKITFATGNWSLFSSRRHSSWQMNSTSRTIPASAVTGEMTNVLSTSGKTDQITQRNNTHRTTITPSSSTSQYSDLRTSSSLSYITFVPTQPWSSRSWGTSGYTSSSSARPTTAVPSTSSKDRTWVPSEPVSERGDADLNTTTTIHAKLTQPSKEDGQLMSSSTESNSRSVLPTESDKSNIPSSHSLKTHSYTEAAFTNDPTSGNHQTVIASQMLSSLADSTLRQSDSSSTRSGNIVTSAGTQSSQILTAEANVASATTTTIVTASTPDIVTVSTPDAKSTLSFSSDQIDLTTTLTSMSLTSSVRKTGRNIYMTDRNQLPVGCGLSYSCQWKYRMSCSICSVGKKFSKNNNKYT